MPTELSDDPEIAERQRQHAYGHASARLQQRYGVGISRQEYDALCARLAAGEARVVWAPRIHEQIVELTHRGRECRAVWNPVRGVIRTFLPDQRSGGGGRRGDQDWIRIKP